MSKVAPKRVSRGVRRYRHIVVGGTSVAVAVAGSLARMSVSAGAGSRVEVESKVKAE
jgi:hypothetical protein